MDRVNETAAHLRRLEAEEAVKARREVIERANRLGIEARTLTDYFHYVLVPWTDLAALLDNREAQS